MCCKVDGCLYGSLQVQDEDVLDVWIIQGIAIFTSDSADPLKALLNRGDFCQKDVLVDHDQLESKASSIGLRTCFRSK